MAKPPGTYHVTNIKGDPGEKGDTGSLAFIEVETIDWDAAPTAEMVGPESHRGAKIGIPLQMPGPELIQVRDDAVQARDEAEAFSATTEILQDGAISSLIDDDTSESARAVRDRALADAVDLANGRIQGFIVDQPRIVQGNTDRAQSRTDELARFTTGLSLPQYDFYDRTGWLGADSNSMDFSTGKFLSAWDSGDGVGAIRYSLPVPAGSTARIVGRLTVPSGAVGTNNALYAAVGISGAPTLSTAGYGDRLHVGINSLNQPLISTYENQSTASQVQDSSGLPAGSYTATIIVDPAHISLTLTNDDGSIEYRQQTPRTNLPGSSSPEVVWVSVANRDSRKSDGVSVDSLDVHVEATRTINHAGNGFREHVWIRSDAADDLRVDIPASYDPRVGSPVVLFFHGTGRTAAEIGNENTADLVKALTTEGYIVAAPNIGGTGPWGNQRSIDCAVAAYEYVMSHYAVTSVALMGASAGVLTALTTLRRGLIPGVTALYGLYPAINLRHQYDTVHTAAIESAYGFTGAGNYASATAGHDPMVGDAREFGLTSMRFSVSPDDTVTQMGPNGVAFVERVRPFAMEASLLEGTGAHGAPSQTVLSDVLSFLDRARSRL